MTDPHQPENMPEATSTSGPQLLQLIASRNEVLSQIHAYTRQQQELIAADRVSALLELLSEKQRFVQRLSELESLLAPHRDADPASRQWESDQQRESCRAAQTQSENLLKEIMQLEQECETQLTEQRDQIAQQLDNTHSAGEACRAYQQHS